jgi:hypothetical protein
MKDLPKQDLPDVPGGFAPDDDCFPPPPGPYPDWPTGPSGPFPGPMPEVTDPSSQV